MAKASTNETEYIVGLNNNPRGPFNRDDLALMARGGMLTEKTRIFVKGWEKWKTIGEVEELSELLVSNPPAQSAPASGSSPQARLPDGWDAELRSTLATLQGSLDKLGVELARRTDQLSEGQKISVEAVADGQGVLTTTLAELKSAESARVKTLSEQLISFQEKTTAFLRESAEKTRQAWSSDLEALELGLADRLKPLAEQFSSLPDKTATILRDSAEKTQQALVADLKALELGLADRIKPLESEQKVILRHLEEQEKGRKSTLETTRESFERLQVTMAAEKEKELLAFSNRVEDMDQRFSALQQAFFLSTEQLKKDLAVSLASWDEKSRKQQTELMQAHAERHQVVLSSQSEAAKGLLQVREQLENRIDVLAEERRSAGEETSRMWADIERRLLRWDSELPKQLQAVITEIQNTPGRLDGLFSKIEQDQQGIAMELAKLPEIFQSRLSESDSKHRQNQEQIDTRLEALRGMVTSQSESFGVRMDAQLQTLQAAAETRSVSLASEMESRTKALTTLLAELRAGMKDNEETSLEHYHVLLAAADDQKAFPERVNRQMLELSGDIKAQMEKVQSGLEAVEKQSQEVVDAVEKAATAESRLADLAGVQAERLSEELASVHQDHLRRLQTSDDERHQHFMALSQAFNGVVAHLEEDLPIRLTKMETQFQDGMDKFSAEMSVMNKTEERIEAGLSKMEGRLQDGLDKAGAGLAQLSKSQADFAAAATGEWKTQKTEIEFLGESLKEGLQSARAAQQKELNHFHEASQEGLRSLSGDLHLFLDQQAKEGQESILELGRQQQTARDTLMQSLSNLGGWTQSLHDKLEKGLAGNQSELNVFRSEVHGKMTEAQTAVHSKMEALGQVHLDRHQAALQAVETLGVLIPKVFNDEIRVAVLKLEKRLAETGADMGDRAKAEALAREKSAAELVLAMSEIEKRLAETGAEMGNRVQAEAEARGQSAVELSSQLGQLEKRLVESGSQLARKIEAEATAQIQAVSEISKSVGQIQQTQGLLQKTLADELTAGLAKRWTLLNADLAQIKSEAGTRQEHLAQRLGELEGKIPAAMAEQLKLQSQSLQGGLALLSKGLEAQEKRVTEVRQELEKQIAGHFAAQQRSTDQLLKLVQEDVARALGAKWDSLHKEVAAIKGAAPAAQKTLVEELHKAVARLPDHLTESYRVTNNALQKQIAEMAQEVSATTQQVVQSRTTLDKAGATHLSSLQEATETGRQQTAAAIRDAKEDREQLYAQLFQELKNWQMEQKKILAAVLKMDKKTEDG